MWELKKKIFHLNPFKKRNLFYSLVAFLCCLNFTAAISIIHSHVPASLVFPMWKRSETDSPKFHIKQCQIVRRTMRTPLQDLAEKSLKGLGTKAWTNWEDRSANSLAYQVSDHSIFLMYWMSQSAEFSSDGSHFSPLQRICLCLRTSGFYPLLIYIFWQNMHGDMFFSLYLHPTPEWDIFTSILVSSSNTLSSVPTLSFSRSSFLSYGGADTSQYWHSK